jgi:hypothetical protein
VVNAELSIADENDAVPTVVIIAAGRGTIDAAVDRRGD